MEGFDTSSLTPIQRGRLEKHLSGSIVLDGEIYRLDEFYRHIARSAIGARKYANGWGITMNDGSYYDCPKIVADTLIII